MGRGRIPLALRKRGKTLQAGAKGRNGGKKILLLNSISRHEHEGDNMTSEGQKIKIHFPQELQRGVYSNNLMVTHTREEFVMDFLLVTPPSGSVTARVIISPGHMKRTIVALQDNLKKYEAKFGNIEKAEDPKGDIGFH